MTGPPDERDDAELFATDTTGDGVADTYVHERVTGVDTTGDGLADSVVLRRDTLRDTDGDGIPDELATEVDRVADVDGDGDLEVERTLTRRHLGTHGAGVGVHGLHHVSVTVRDDATARRFYVEVLGLEVLPRPDFGFGGSWLGAPDGRQVHLIEGDAPPAPGNHLALAVEDADAAVASLRAAGVVVGDPTDGPGGRQVFLEDPSGNLVELNEQRRPDPPARGGR